MVAGAEIRERPCPKTAPPAMVATERRMGLERQRATSDCASGLAAIYPLRAWVIILRVAHREALRRRAAFLRKERQRANPQPKGGGTHFENK